MNNNNDYQLEDAENAAVQKSQNLKRGLAVGAGVVAAGGAAYAATQMSGGGGSDTPEVSADDILAGAQAAADAAADSADPATATVVHDTHHTESHVHVHHHHPQPTPNPGQNPGGDHEPNVEVQESSLLYDEDGNYIGAVEEGVIDGKNFKIIDSDGNGKGDLIGIDENGNGIYEDNEISYMDNESYDIGNGKTVSIYQQDETGEPVLVARGTPDEIIPSIADNNNPGGDDIDNIRNDFEDEKTGEVYKDDLAENNPDYNNHAEDNLYTAQMETSDNNPGYITAEIEDVQPDYGYGENSDLAAADPTYVDPVQDVASYDYNDASQDVADYSYNDASHDVADYSTPDYGYSEPASDFGASDDFGGGMDESYNFEA